VRLAEHASEHVALLAESIVAALPDALWVLGEGGVVIFVNQRMADLLGVEPRYLVGTRALDIVHESTREAYALYLSSLDTACTSGVDDAEYCLITPDGSPLAVTLSHAPMGHTGGAGLTWLQRVVEPSSLKQEVERLSPREEQLAQAQRVARIVSYDVDLATGSLTWSDELFRLCGVDPSRTAPTYEAFLACVHPDDREHVTRLGLETIESGVTSEFDFRFVGQGGEERWLRHRAEVVRDANGDAVRVIGISQDVTERKMSEKTVAFLSAMASAANEATSLRDVLLAPGGLIMPNTAGPVTVLSVTSSGEGENFSHMGDTWAGASNEVRLASRALADRIALEGRTIDEVGPEGTVLIGGPVRTGDRVACVLVSDTQRVTFDAADINIFQQMLNMLSSVAQREWAAEELAQARDQALDASKAKSEFLATMSHEIRTPLNGVIGLSELLASSELTAHQRRLAQGVDQAGRTLLALINDILDLSKIEAGRLDLEEVDFDPRMVIEHSATLVADQARAKGLELLVSSATDMPSQLRGDSVRFGQVITNLVANAVKFTSAGEVNVRATLGHGPHGDQVRIEVVDTGIGIAVAALDRLFQPFSQADSSVTRQYGGTGLGLAISKRIVAAMGGEIGVESELGVGSKFWFTASLSISSSYDTPPGQLEQAVAGLRVLVVDDNETNRFIVTELLSAWNVAVTTEASAYAALVELDQARRDEEAYDIVLIDHMMPRVDGVQLANIVRADPGHEDTRLVLLSSASPPGEDFLREAGFNSFLSKPIMSGCLLNQLAELGGLLGPNAAEAAPARDIRLDPNRERILVVEDNPINQMVAEGVLESLGYAVVVAADGAAGVRAVAADEGFAAVLMDCQMPVMSGYAAARAIRAAQRTTRRLPIIAMTAAAVPEERQRCLDAGMDDFLLKPVDREQLRDTLAHWIGSAG
jgi:PAS domain S-box-containing protein